MRPQTIGAAEGNDPNKVFPKLRCPGSSPRAFRLPSRGPIHGRELLFYGPARWRSWGRGAVIRHAIDHLGGEVEDLFGIADQASENGLLLFSASSRFHSKSESSSINCFHLLVVLNRFPDAPFPLPRHKQNWRNFPPLPSNQVRGQAWSSPRAQVTTGFSAVDVSQGEGAAEGRGKHEAS